MMEYVISHPAGFDKNVLIELGLYLDFPFSLNILQHPLARILDP